MMGTAEWTKEAAERARLAAALGWDHGGREPMPPRAVRARAEEIGLDLGSFACAPARNARDVTPLPGASVAVAEWIDHLTSKPQQRYAKRVLEMLSTGSDQMVQPPDYGLTWEQGAAILSGLQGVMGLRDES